MLQVLMESKQLVFWIIDENKTEIYVVVIIASSLHRCISHRNIKSSPICLTLIDPKGWEVIVT